jgi:hypothetical protein
MLKKIVTVSIKAEIHTENFLNSIGHANLHQVQILYLIIQFDVPKITISMDRSNKRCG